MRRIADSLAKCRTSLIELAKGHVAVDGKGRCTRCHVEAPCPTRQTLARLDNELVEQTAVADSGGPDEWSTADGPVPEVNQDRRLRQLYDARNRWRTALTRLTIDHMLEDGKGRCTQCGVAAPCDTEGSDADQSGHRPADREVRVDGRRSTRSGPREPPNDGLLPGPGRRRLGRDVDPTPGLASLAADPAAHPCRRRFTAPLAEPPFGVLRRDDVHLVPGGVDEDVVSDHQRGEGVGLVLTGLPGDRRLSRSGRCPAMRVFPVSRPWSSAADRAIASPPPRPLPFEGRW
jgi:hypothetical protein